MADNGSNNNENKPEKTGRNSTIIIIFIAVILTIIFWIQYNNFKDAGLQKVNYSQFLEELDKQEVTDVEIRKDKITYTPVKVGKVTEDIRYYAIRPDDYQLVDRLKTAKVDFEVIDEGSNAFMEQILSWVIMLAIFYLLTMFIMRKATSGGGIMNVGKSTAKLYDMQKATGVSFKDVAGEEEAKESLTEMVDFLKEPERYLEIGAKLPKGALLVGPPGTGKTLLAKAVAGEAGVPFFSLSGSEFVEMYVGVGASRVRDLFKQANQKAPCIIFIDEIDAIGRSRDTRHMGGDSEREQTLNQLLSEMDGFDSSKGIIILAATNRPEVLDKALLRPGRFDRRVIVDKPDQRGREQILRVHAKNVKLDETVDLGEIAFATSGSVGADLANIINEAALTAVRKGRKFVSQNDLLESIEVVFAGKEKKDRILNKEEKRIVAFHEAGHALLTMLTKDTMPIQKITIVPRTMGSLGYVWQTPEEEKFLESQTEMESQMVIFMGGRAAEQLVFNSITSGASNDIEQATKIARAMVTQYGMSEKLGQVQLESVTGQYLDGRTVLQCSEETTTKVDSEVRKLIKGSYEKAEKLLKKNMNVLTAVAEFLIEHETITGKQFVEIYENMTGKKVGGTVNDIAGRLEAAKAEEAKVEASKAEVKKEKETPDTFRVYASEEFLKHRDELLKGNGDSNAQAETSKEETDAPVANVAPKKDEKMVMPWESFAQEQSQSDAEESVEENVTEVETAEAKSENAEATEVAEAKTEVETTEASEAKSEADATEEKKDEE